MDKTKVLNWFIRLSREMLIDPMRKRKCRIVDSELMKWAHFEGRLREVADEMGVRYRAYDISRKEKGVWYYSPDGFYLWMGANINIIRRIPELKKVSDAWEIIEQKSRARRRVHPGRFKSSEDYERKLNRMTLEGYKQLRMVFSGK